MLRDRSGEQAGGVTVQKYDSTQQIDTVCLMTAVERRGSGAVPQGVSTLQKPSEMSRCRSQHLLNSDGTDHRVAQDLSTDRHAVLDHDGFTSLREMEASNNHVIVAF